MSDFDEVLERLLGDPAFKAGLAADPQRALAGYHLTPDELDILQSQVGEAGGQAHVEQRTSKASMFGVISSIGSGLGSGLTDMLHGGGHTVAGELHGHGTTGGGHGLRDVVEQYNGRHAAPTSGLEDAHSSASGSSHFESHTEYHSETYTSSGTVYQSGGYQPPAYGAEAVAGGLAGYTPEAGHGGTGVTGALSGLNAEDLSGHGPNHGIAAGVQGLVDHVQHGQIPGQAPTDGYHARVDWDGDGKWDHATYVNRADGGVDIVVDTNGDGHPEFVGHDTDRDGLINSSDVDSNSDGVVDARYEDTNGDGWLDRRVR